MQVRRGHPGQFLGRCADFLYRRGLFHRVVAEFDAGFPDFPGGLDGHIGVGREIVAELPQRPGDAARDQGDGHQQAQNHDPNGRTDQPERQPGRGDALGRVSVDVPRDGGGKAVEYFGDLHELAVLVGVEVVEPLVVFLSIARFDDFIAQPDNGLKRRVGLHLG